MTNINNLKCELVFYAPHSPDLLPSNYLLFSNLKECFAGKRFVNNEEMESVVDGYFEEFNGSHYNQGIEAIEHGRRNCVELNEDCIEK